MQLYFIGWHNPSQCQSFLYSMVSITRIVHRKSNFPCNFWALDSGSRTMILKKAHLSTKKYAKKVHRWCRNDGHLMFASCQDYLCTGEILQKTQLSVSKHQELTILRYDNLHSFLLDIELNSKDMLLNLDYLTYGTDLPDIETQFFQVQELMPYEDFPLPYILPILQGDTKEDYLRHLDLYGSRLKQPGKWVGVGSLKRFSRQPQMVLDILRAIKAVRPDLRLHGFGLSKKCLSVPAIRKLIYSADSSAHVLANGSGKQKYVNQHDPQTALIYSKPIYEAIAYDQKIRQMWAEKFGNSDIFY